MSSTAGSWVQQLRPRRSDDLQPSCQRATWNQAVAQLGPGPASWAVDISKEIAKLIVGPRISPAWRHSAAEELRPTCEAVIMLSLVALDRGEQAPTTVPAETAQQLANAVRRRTPLAHLLDIQRAAHREFSDALINEFCRIVPADQQSQNLPELSRFLVDHVSSFSSACGAAYVAEEQSWLASVEGSRTEIVRSLLDGRPVVGDPSPRLRYELSNRTHIGLVVHRHGGDAAPEPADLQSTALSMLGDIGVVSCLTVAHDEREVWAWGSVLDPGTATVRAVREMAGVMVAVGRPAPGMEGFRRTHEEATAAARVAMLAPPTTSRRTVFYEDVRLVALVTKDLHQAVLFARAELGALAQENEGALRETVRAFLECNCSPAGAALELNVAKNTVVYRIKRAEELLGRSVKEQQGFLWAALHVAEMIDVSAVPPSGYGAAVPPRGRRRRSG